MLFPRVCRFSHHPTARQSQSHDFGKQLECKPASIERASCQVCCNSSRFEGASLPGARGAFLQSSHCPRTVWI